MEAKQQVSNPPPGICSIDVNRKVCWCTIVHGPHALLRSDRYSLHQLQEQWTCMLLQVYNGAPNPHIRTFGHSPRLAHCPPEDYYYRAFSSTKRGLQPLVLC
ncbi:hypothetical protein TNCV_4495971 [Trichonephila clavipes]|nr:hypothetical protein TNCV_4495971 [Trichonephila clavipes]